MAPETIDSSMGSVSPKRRRSDDDINDQPINLKGSQFVMPTPPTSNDSPIGSMAQFKRELSPAGSISTLSSIPDVSSIDTPNAQQNPSSAPPAKKRKLTATEKAEQKREKEMKKAQQEEEKRIKAEETRQKKEEQENKKREKELATQAKKREKELAEEAKKEAVLKKERSQLRLGSYFQSKATVQDADDSNAKSDHVATRRRSLSAFDDEKEQIASTQAAQKAVTEKKPSVPDPANSDYFKFFLPFTPKPNMSLAQTFVPDDLEEVQARFDADVNTNISAEERELGLRPASVSVKDHFLVHRHARGIPTLRLSKLIAQLEGTKSKTIDLTGDVTEPLQKLAQISMRQLHFHEDVRPAFFGTYTSIESPRKMRKLRRNPFARERTDTNYDYDSEAEWEEPEPEDEELGDEEDEEGSNGDEDEMEGFLDDENDELSARRKLLTGGLEVQCSGLCWEDRQGKLTMPPESVYGLRTQFLLPGFQGKTIDPYSTVYWGEVSATTAVTAEPAKTLRPPLKERSSNTASVSNSPWPIEDKKTTKKPGNQKSMNSEELERFKAAVVGSSLGKLELQTHLKTIFPSFTAALVKDTLGDSFAFMGKDKASKKWKFVGNDD